MKNTKYIKSSHPKKNTQAADHQSSPPFQGGVPEGGGGSVSFFEGISSSGGGGSLSPSQGISPSGGGGLACRSQGEMPSNEGRNNLNNLPYLNNFRKKLRNKSTPAEARLWTMLKGRQLDGRKFRRQHSFANYILDFYCPEERIAIELDGQGHFVAAQKEYDRVRDFFLLTCGIRVLRFENKCVWDNPSGLLNEVKKYFGQQTPNHPYTP